MTTEYQRNVRAQYAALGQFVESFELMVNEARETCITLLSKDRHHRNLIEIALHHQSLTAKPIFEMMRAVIVEIVNADIKRHLETGRRADTEPAHATDERGAPVQFSPADREVFFGVLKTIAEEYNDLVNKRNSLLHATWFVGYTSPDDRSASEFFARKYAITKDGAKLLQLPKKAIELADLSARCDATRRWTGQLDVCLSNSGMIHYYFGRSGKDWVLIHHSSNGRRMTRLPEQ